MDSTINRSKLVYENIDSLITELCPNDLSIDINLAVSVSKTSPRFEMWFNDLLVFDEYVINGNRELKFNFVNVDKFTKLIFRMSNKLNGETVIKNGKIVNDTFILIYDLRINNFSLINDINFFHNHLTYCVEKIPELPKKGFWKNNSELIISFDNPFIFWYNERTDKNISLATPLLHKSKNSEFGNFTDEVKLELVESLKKLNF